MQIPCVKSCFVKTTLCSLKLISSTCYSFLIDHKFALFGGRDFQQTGGIPMVIIYAPLLASCFQTDFIHGLFTESEKKLDLYINFIKKDDILSLNNYTFGDLFYRFIPIALGIKDTKLRMCVLPTLTYISQLTMRAD
jgi:hypothetical protein